MATQSPAFGESEFEGDYRPVTATLSAPQPTNARIEPADLTYLSELADALNTTLDLDTLLKRTAELVSAIIRYRIFAILLLNDHTHELRMRFQIGHTKEITRRRIPLGEGIVGQVAVSRQPILIEDVETDQRYIPANEGVRSELAVPLIAKNRLIGVMDLESEEPGAFRPEHLRLLQLTASRIAQAIVNARLYARVSRQAHQLTVLNEISVELTSILDVDLLFERVCQSMRRLIDYQMFSVLLLDAKGENLVTRYAWKFGASEMPKRHLPVSEGITGAAVREWRVLSVADVTQDPRYVNTNPETRSELAVPLFHKGKVIGALDLEHTEAGFFNDDHKRMAVTLASQVAIAIENARLYQAVRAQEDQLERDLAMAREVQLRLLPTRAPELPHARLAMKFLPARSIGGDLYDFLDYGSGVQAIVLGDVSGKAAPAALFAALVSGIMRSAALHHPEPAEMLVQLNDAIRERKLESQYVTLLYALWDDPTRTLRLANAGAVQPIQCRNGHSRILQAEGFPLGLMPDAMYDELVVETQPGDVLIFVSDGILDAEDPQGEMYGSERLSEILSHHQQDEPDTLAELILADVSRFQGERERFDDETIIVLKVL